MANLNEYNSRTVMATGDDENFPMNLGDIRALLKKLDDAPDDCLVAVSNVMLAFTVFGREYNTFTHMAIDVPQAREIVAL